MIHWVEDMQPKEFTEQLCWFAETVIPALQR